MVRALVLLYTFISKRLTTAKRKERVESSFALLIHPIPSDGTMFPLESPDFYRFITRTRNPPLDRTIKVTSVFDSRNSNYLESRSFERAFSPMNIVPRGARGVTIVGR